MKKLLLIFGILNVLVSFSVFAQIGGSVQTITVSVLGQENCQEKIEQLKNDLLEDEKYIIFESKCKRRSNVMFAGTYDYFAFVTILNDAKKSYNDDRMITIDSPNRESCENDIRSIVNSLDGLGISFSTNYTCSDVILTDSLYAPSRGIITLEN